MATKPIWLNVTPSSGSGNGTLSNSSTEHTGRIARTGTVTVTAVGVASPSTYRLQRLSLHHSTTEQRCRLRRLLAR